ncbi:MAG TPA: 5'-nucleotidase domain-containing protein, partial [Candidatus Eisenbacteria bacterium]|nr:5'-nucleotidase domain-containing protein [Candidatus Eisenbacteria bacterium]
MSDVKKVRGGATGSPAPPATSRPAEAPDATPAGVAPAGAVPETEAPPAKPSGGAGAPGVAAPSAPAKPHAAPPTAAHHAHPGAPHEPSARALRYREHRIPRRHRVFVNRNLRMTQIRAIGFDLDHTLAHYDPTSVEEL